MFERFHNHLLISSFDLRCCLCCTVNPRHDFEVRSCRPELGSKCSRCIRAVFLPKCLGAWNLHRLTLPDDLEAMWFFSSLSGGVGTEGLYNYASANTYLDELARMRRSMALPAVSIQFPEVEEAGMAAAYVRSGAATVSLATVRRALQQLLRQPSSPVVALIPSGYLIARSVYHWLALQPLEARRNKDLWKQMERIEKENKEEVKELRKEIRNRKESNAKIYHYISYSHKY
eukprot:s373_g17.t1